MKTPKGSGFMPGFMPTAVKADVIVPAASGHEVVLLTWDTEDAEAEIDVQSHTVVAWRVVAEEHKAYPIVVGGIARNQAALFRQPDGFYVWPDVSFAVTLEEVIDELRRMIKNRTANFY